MHADVVYRLNCSTVFVAVVE